AVDQLADMAAAAAVPGAVDLAVEAELVAGLLAHARARRGRERVAVRVDQHVAACVDRPAELVDRAPEVVDRVAVDRAEREAVRVDPRRPGRARGRAGRVDVAAEVEGLRLLRAHRLEHEAAAGDGEDGAAGACEEPAPRARAG